MPLTKIQWDSISLVPDEKDLWAKNGANLVWVGAHSNSSSQYKANSFHLVNGWPAELANLENE